MLIYFILIKDIIFNLIFKMDIFRHLKSNFELIERAQVFQFLFILDLLHYIVYVLFSEFNLQAQ